MIIKDKYYKWTCKDMIPNKQKKSRQHRFGNKVFLRIVGIPMRTNCAPLIADLVLYCYESQIMIRLKKNNLPMTH